MSNFLEQASRTRIAIEVGRNNWIEVGDSTLQIGSNAVQVTKRCSGRSDLHLTREEAWSLLRVLTEFLVTTMYRNESQEAEHGPTGTTVPDADGA